MRYVFLRFPEFRRKALTFSYDDGVQEDKRLVGILNRYDLKGTFNINSELFATYRRMSKEEVMELFADSPHEVAVHGARHLSLAEVDEAVATRDIITDRQNLETLFGRIIKGSAYANGATSDSVIQGLKKCGIHYARIGGSTEDFGLPTDWYRWQGTCHHNHPRLMELAKQFVEVEESNYYWANRPMVFYLLGHSYEFADQNNWQVIEEFAEYMGNRDEIWYATNGEIYDYVQAYNRLEYSVDGNIIYNPTNTGIYLCYHGRNVFVPAGGTVVQ